MSTAVRLLAESWQHRHSGNCLAFLATAEHHVITSTPHGRVLQIAKTLWPGSLRLSAGKLYFFFFPKKINSITKFKATVGGC